MTRGYAEIAQHFREQIRNGTLRPGDRLPTIKEVIEQFSVSNTTAVRAYKTLKDEGLTTSARGAGTVVAPHGSDNIATRVKTFAATGRALAANETSEIIEVGMVGAEEVVAQRLDVEPGTPVHVRRRVVSRDGVPIHMSSSFYPAYVMEVTPELAEPVSTGGSRELAATRLGVAQDYVTEEHTARLATDPEKAALGLTGSVVVMQVVRTVVLTDGRIVEVAVKIVNGSTVLRTTTSLNGS